MDHLIKKSQELCSKVLMLLAIEFCVKADAHLPIMRILRKVGIGLCFEGFQYYMPHVFPQVGFRGWIFSVADEENKDSRVGKNTHESRGDARMLRDKLAAWRTADISSCAPGELIDITTVRVDDAMPMATRMENYIRDIKNPYLFRVGDTIVQIEFTGGTSLQNRMETLFRSKNQ